MRAFWKKTPKFQRSWKGTFFSNFEFFRKMLDFAGLLLTGRLTISQGIGRDITSTPLWSLKIDPQVRLLWPLERVASCVPHLKMLIPILSYKAVLGTWFKEKQRTYNFQLPYWITGICFYCAECNPKMQSTNISLARVSRHPNKRAGRDVVRRCEQQAKHSG